MKGFTIAPTFFYRSPLPVQTIDGVDLNLQRREQRPPGARLPVHGVGQAPKDIGACETWNCGRGAWRTQMNLRVVEVASAWAARRALEAIGEVFNLFNAKNPAGFTHRQQPGTERVNPTSCSRPRSRATSSSPSSASGRSGSASRSNPSGVNRRIVPGPHPQGCGPFFIPGRVIGFRPEALGRLPTQLMPLSWPASRSRRLPLALGGIALVAIAWAVASRLFPVWPPDGHGKPAAERWRPNVLLVTIDTLRADRTGGDLTPNLNALAARGASFLNARSPVPLTLPAHTSLMTGLIPPHHGVRLNGLHRLPPETRTLATILRESGYHTGAFVGA